MGSGLPRPLPIDLFAALGRLGRRLRIQGDGQQPYISPYISATTDLDELLRTPKLPPQVAKDLTSGTAYTAYFTVPTGKRWKIFKIFRDGTTGTSRVRIARTDGQSIPLTNNETTGKVIDIDAPLTMDEGWSVGMNATNNGADTNIGMNILYEEEDAF
jgi:hypothetical protein